MTMYKLRLRFYYPLALGGLPWWARLRFVLVHYFLVVGFLIHPLLLVGLCGLAALLLLFETFKKTAYTSDNISFGWQRVGLAAVVALSFLGLYANNSVQAAHWWWVSLGGSALSLYDGYLVWRGLTGLFYLKIK